MLSKGPVVYFIPLLLAFYFSPVLTEAQSQRTQPLRDVLQLTEKKFDVVFTYADEIVEGVQVTAPPQRSTLQITLQLISEQTGLLFQSIGTRYIVIVKKMQEERSVICGTLLSSDTGEPVWGATIAANGAATVSNESGSFELAKREGTIVIRSIGFESLVLSTKDFPDECTPLFMTPSYTTLEEVTVNDVVATGIEEKVDGSITIRPDIVGILPGLPQPDALQALQYMPGVRSVAEAAADINIRGGTNDQNLVLLDGIKVYQTGHFFGLISGLNPHVISKVNLTKNGTSSYFGESTSATINLQTTDKVAEKLAGGGGINLLYADAFLDVPLTKKMSVQLAGRRSLPSSWQTPTYAQYFNRAFRNSEITGNNGARNQAFYFFDTNLKLVYDVTSRDKVRATFFNVANQLEFKETAGTDQRNSSLQQRSTGASASYSRLWSDKVKTTAEGYISAYALDAVNQNIPLNQQLTQANEVLETGLRVSAFVQVRENLFLQTGYQFSETGITNSDRVNNPVFSRFIKEVNRAQTVFAEGNFTANDERTSLRGGLRMNYFSKPGEFTIEPRLVFHQKLPLHLSVEVLGEVKSQTSVQAIDLQSDFLGVEKRRWLMSNGIDVPILKSRQVSTGLAYNNEGLLVSADVFYKNVTGILTSSQGFQNQFQTVRSIGEYTIAGLELLMNKRWNSFDGWLGYTWSKSEYEFPELIPPAFPNNLDILHSLNGGVSARLNQLEVSVGANWHSGNPTTLPVEAQAVSSGTVNYRAPNSSRLPNYFRIDLSARWHFYYGNKVRGQLGISLWNVLNRENVLSQYYRVATSSQAVAVRQLGLDFTPNAFFRVDF